MRQPRPDAPFCLTADGFRTWDRFAEDICRFRPALEGRDAICNLASSRYEFCVVLAAALLNGQTVLLPPSRAEKAVQAVVRDWTSPLCVMSLADLPTSDSPAPGMGPHEVLQALSMAEGVIHVFTSGSTGSPVRLIKTWETLRAGAGVCEHIIQHAGLLPGGCLIAGTTPHQHMYGLEATIFEGLGYGHMLYDQPVFYPDDLGAVVDACRGQGLEQVVLVTSPPHLKFLARPLADFPEISCVISATSPLSVDLAKQVEAGLPRAVYEIYGSTETGSLAWRRTTETDIWQPLAGFTLLPSPDGWRAAAPHLADVTALNDEIEQLSDGGFRLLGRRGDMVQVAGKRQSLGALNAALAGCDAIADGVVLRERLADEDRLYLIVVAGNQPPADLGREVRTHMLAAVDPVFVPRTVHIVDALPRNETGKLLAEQQDMLLRKIRTGGPNAVGRVGL